MAKKSNSPEEHAYGGALSNLQKKIRAAERLYSTLIESAGVAEKNAVGLELALHSDGSLTVHPAADIPAGEAYVVRR